MCNGRGRFKPSVTRSAGEQMASPLWWGRRWMSWGFLTLVMSGCVDGDNSDISEITRTRMMRRSYSSGSAVDRQMDALVAPTNVGPTLLDCADALHGTPHPSSHCPAQMHSPLLIQIQPLQATSFPARLCRCTPSHCMVRYTTLLDTLHYYYNYNHYVLHPSSCTYKCTPHYWLYRKSSFVLFFFRE